MKTSRVVITGIGAITPCGIGWQSLWQSALIGKSAIAGVTRFNPADSIVNLAAEVGTFAIDDFWPGKAGNRLDRSAQFAIAAAQLAIRDSDADPIRFDSSRCGVFDGSSLGALAVLLQEHRGFLQGERCRGGPGTLISGMNGNSAAAIAERYGLHGAAESFAMGSVSSTTAIGRAFGAVRRGEVEFAITGGCEAPLYPEILLPFVKAKVLSRCKDEPAGACRPFASNRDGFVMGEGAVYLALENLDHALARDARIYSEIVGFSQTVDAFHPTSPDPSGRFLTEAIAACLRSANRKPHEVNYVNVHGSATPQNDVAEASAIRAVFGESSPWCGSTKPITGHLLGACGAVEAAICALATSCDQIPVSINSQPRDESCQLSVVESTISSQQVDLAVSINNSFGGRNCALAFQKYITN